MRTHIRMFINPIPMTSSLTHSLPISPIRLALSAATASYHQRWLSLPWSALTLPPLVKAIPLFPATVAYFESQWHSPGIFPSSHITPYISAKKYERIQSTTIPAVQIMTSLAWRPPPPPSDVLDSSYEPSAITPFLTGTSHWFMNPSK